MMTLIHREQVYANELAFGGGWPLVFNIDQSGVSVTGKRSMLEDVLYPGPFFVNTLTCF